MILDVFHINYKSHTKNVNYATMFMMLIVN